MKKEHLPDDLRPLPWYRQRLAQTRAWWVRSRNRRQDAYRNLKTAGRKGLTLAISVVGATLVSFGVYSTYAPAGYVVGGVLLWMIQWNYGEQKGSGR